MENSVKYHSIRKDRNFYEFLNSMKELYSERMAVKYKRDGKLNEVTYREMIENICSIFNYLKKENVSNVNVGILSENRYEYIPIYLGTVLDNVIAPIDRELTKEKIEGLLQKFDIEVLFYTNRTKNKIEDLIKTENIKFINIDEEFVSIINSKYDIQKMLEQAKKMPDDKISVIGFTSGTTDSIKGAMLTNENIVLNVWSAHRNNVWKETCYVSLPMNHTYGFNHGMLAGLYVGVTLCLNTELKYFLNELKEYNPYYMGAVPLMVETIYKNITNEVRRRKKERLFKTMISVSNLLLKFKIDIRKKLFGNFLCPNLKYIVSGGAKLDSEYVKKFEELGITLLNGYGMTECSPLISVNRTVNNIAESVGTIVDGIDVKIAEDGEILIKGHNVMRGYYNDEELTKAAFDGEYFKTGDLGYIENHVLYVTGRKKNLIILSNGKNFSPEEVENKLLKSEFVDECIVCDKNEKVVALIYSENENEEEIKNAVELANKELPSYMNIDRYELMKEPFEKNSSRKIVRNAYVR